MNTPVSTVSTPRLLTAPRWLAVGALAAGLTACGGGSGSGGGDSSTSGTGTLRLALTDAPACGYDAVNVTVQSVRLHQSATADDSDGGWQTVALDTPRQVDLLTLSNGVLMELGEAQLPVGRYSQLRLVLAEGGGANTVVPSGGAERPLTTPSAQRSGLKLNVAMDVEPGQMADYVIDFDACRSVVRAGQSGQYLLKPVLTVLPRTITGVGGEVDTALVSPDTTVSLQRDGVTVRSATPTPTGSFLLQPVPAGSYTFVLQSPGRATTVVEAVTVGADQVARLHPLGQPLNPPLTLSETGSGMGTLSGTVTPATDASVRALQPLTGGPVLELISRPVDGDTGAYLYRVATAAPQRATHAAGEALTFSTDADAAGQFSLQAVIDGIATPVAGPFVLVEDVILVTNFPQP
jgi:hypothetical protein